MDSPLHVANRTTTSSNRKRKSMDNSAGNVISQGKSQQKENADIGAEKRAKLSGKSLLRKRGLGVRSNTTMGEGSTSSTPSGSSPGYQNHRQSPAARGKWDPSLQTRKLRNVTVATQNLCSPQMLLCVRWNTGENIAELAQDTLVVVEEFRKQVNKFPNILKVASTTTKRELTLLKTHGCRSENPQVHTAFVQSRNSLKMLVGLR